MKQRFFVSATIVLAMSMSGCAIHPLPEDFSGVDTRDIVRQIRCETREALIDLVGDFLTKNRVDDSARAIGASYFVERTKPLSDFSPKLVSRFVKNSLDVFWTTGIAYNFELQMQENNNVGAGIGFGNPFTRGTTIGATQLDVGGRLDRQRGTRRTFTVTDTIGELISKVPESYCVNKIVGPNYAYPVTGQIGMKEVLSTFVYLTVFGGLGNDKDPRNPAAPPTMVDAVTFETVILGRVNPAKVVFSAIPNHFALVNASLDAEVKRRDTHIVTVGLALDSAAASELGPYRDFLFNRYGGPSPVGPMRTGQIQGALFGRLLTASGSRAEIAAAQAVDQFLTQRLFSPVININQ